MRYVILLLLLATALYLIFRHGGNRGGTTQGSRVRVRELPSVLERLRESGRDGSFAGLVVPDPKRPDEEPVNVQFSVEEGTVGFDWLLLQQLNLVDQDRFTDFAMARGYPYQRRSMNGVAYIRVTSGDLAALATGVMTELYSLTPDEEVKLVTEGFDWP